jgi:hypothetical protein
VRHIRKALVPCAAVLMLSACGASTIATTQPASTPTAAPASAVPTPTPDLVAIARQAYSQAVSVVNGVDARVAAEEGPLKTYTALVKPERQWLAALETWQTALSKIAWPPTVQSAATALLASVKTEIRAVSTFVAHPNAATWKAEGTAGKATASAAAAVRLAFHLLPA